jgi:diguanylate cyclase (GGDEF)-like protein
VPVGFLTQHRTGSGIAVPLVVGSDVAGVLTAGSNHTGFFTEDETRVLLRLSSQASVALENARLHASVQALSLTDPLTGLPNRRQLTIHLEREVGAARRGRSLVMCMHDLDYFKLYNDSAGHLAGDDALRAFGQILHEENRTMNLVARYGGDEFVSVLSEATLEGAQIYMQRVLARLEKDPILAPSNIKVSTGLAAFDREKMKSAADVIQAADAALYRVKGSRRR